MFLTDHDDPHRSPKPRPTGSLNPDDAWAVSPYFSYQTTRREDADASRETVQAQDQGELPPGRRRSVGPHHRARARGTSNSTVSDTISRLKAAGPLWADVDATSEADKERRLYREREHVAPEPRQPDWAYVPKELGRRHITLRLLRHEYHADHPDGYAHRWFCERCHPWSKTLDPVMRQQRTFGEKVSVDWAGDTVALGDADTDELGAAHLLSRCSEPATSPTPEAFGNEEPRTSSPGT